MSEYDRLQLWREFYGEFIVMCDRTEKGLDKTDRPLLIRHFYDLLHYIPGNARGAYKTPIVRSFHLPLRIEPPIEAGILCLGHVLFRHEIRVRVAGI